MNPTHTRPAILHISEALIRAQRFETRGSLCENPERAARILASLVMHFRECMPSGSGFDMGCSLDLDRSTPQSIQFTAPFHRMDENGSYCGWVTYRCRVIPTFQGIDLIVRGPKCDGLIDYVHEVLHSALTATVTWPALIEND